VAEQLRLPTLRSARLPFRVRRRTVRRAVWRELAAHTDEALKHGFEIRPLVEDSMLLAELRVRYRAAARVMRRQTGAPRAAFAGTLEGRRIHQLMTLLSERISAREDKILCG